MFCIGLAPTFPGMRLRFSTPPKLRSKHFSTNSCQFIPAPASTRTDLSDSCRILKPLISFLRTRPSKFFVNRILLPPPRMKSSWFLFSLRRTNNSSSDLKRAKNDAEALIPNVLCVFNKVFLWSMVQKYIQIRVEIQMVLKTY